MSIIDHDGVSVGIVRDQVVAVRTAGGWDRVTAVAQLARPGFTPGATAYDDYEDRRSVLIHYDGHKPAAVTVFDPTLVDEWVERLADAGRDATAVMTGVELRGIREVCGYSIIELADLLGTSRASMQRMERGTQPVRAEYAGVMRGLLDAYHADRDAEAGRTSAVITVSSGWKDGRPPRWWRQVAVEAAVLRAARVESGD